MQITHTVLFSLILAVSFSSTADDHTSSEQSGTVIQMPLSEKANLHANDLPKRGTTMERVMEKYGVPNKKHPAKGQPPIVRWDYENFSVYFETNSVIHSVDRRAK